MRWLIFAFGVALALGGAASIVAGVPYIRIEFGWTEVIAGTTALSAGIVTLGLGAVLNALRGLELRLIESRRAATQDAPASAFPTAETMASPAAATVLAGDEVDGVNHETDGLPTAVVERDGTPTPAKRPLMGRMRSKLSTMGTPGNDRAEPAASLGPLLTTDRSSEIGPAAAMASRNRDEASHGQVDQPEPARSRYGVRPSVASLTRAEADDRVPSLIPPPRQSAAGNADAEPVSNIDAPTVVGRYESGGASYVLFSDGTIEVETEAGTHRFASMEELKTYIDQQDGSAVS